MGTEAFALLDAILADIQLIIKFCGFIIYAYRDLQFAILHYICVMRKHNGMRPQDIVILTDLLVNPEFSTQKKDIGHRLFISQSEVSESLHRSILAGLASDKSIIYVSAFIGFLQYGFRYVYPVRPGGMTRGVGTAHSHPYMREAFVSQLNYVWPDFNGNEQGLAVEPLYARQVDAVKNNPKLYKALALMDVLRVGRTREVSVALAEIKNMFNNGQSQRKHSANKSS